MLEGDSLLRELAQSAALGALFVGLVGVFAAAALALRQMRRSSAHPLVFAEPALRLSPIRPSEPGWYWVTARSFEPEIVWVVQRGEERVAMRCRGEPAPHEHPLTSPYFDGCGWAGPLTPPSALFAYRRRRPPQGPRPD